jgi:hypothetical protein
MPFQQEGSKCAPRSMRAEDTTKQIGAQLEWLKVWIPSFGCEALQCKQLLELPATLFPL